MATKQTNRKRKAVKPVHQELTSFVVPEANLLHKEDQVVEEKQSYAMVTGLLQVLVASIAYQRGLFPKSCFETRLPSLISTEAHHSYKQADTGSNLTCSNDEMEHFAAALAQRDQPLMVLAPGKTNGVKRLLVWLDEVFKGLLDRSLDGVQFSIYGDKSKPSEILELYTFFFEYRDGKDGERRLVGLTAPSRGSITTRSVRTDMVKVIDQLNNYQQQLPSLPKERYLMCHLFHSPNAPRHHRPLGFHTCTDTHMTIVENGLWHMKPQRFGPLDSGIHSMCLDIGFMARNHTAKDLGDRPVLPQSMEHTRTIPLVLKPDLERRSNADAAPPMNVRMTKRRRGDFTQADEQEDSTRRTSLHGSVQNFRKSLSAKGQTTNQGRLSKNSRGSVWIHNTLRGDSLLPTQIMEAHGPPALPTWNFKLRPAKALAMDVKKDKRQWIASLDDRVVRCECSCDREEPPMLQCICCNKLQHYHCYGFAIETRVHEHHCYQCILEDTNPSKLKDIKSLAIFRRALWILYEKTPSSPEKFAKELHFNKETTQGLIQRLDKGGYLASGTTQLSPVTTSEQLKLREQLYCDPHTIIGIHYEHPEYTASANTDTEDENSRRKRTKV